MFREISVDPRVARVCRITAISAHSIDNATLADAFAEAWASRIEDLQQQLGRVTAGELPRVRAVRDMYRELGIDPHHTRPSSEALVRRLLRGDKLTSISAIVDTANLWSISTCCPVGVYDGKMLRGILTCRLGEKGEGYPGIRKEWVNVGNRILLADEDGPFGNPTADSLRTAVTVATTDVVGVAFQPLSFPAAEVAQLEMALTELSTG